MSHSIDPATLAAAGAAVTYPVEMVDLEFASGTVRFHTWIGDLVWNGNTYTGTGTLGGISGIEETSEPSRSTTTLTLRGVPNDIIAIALNEHYQGRPCTVREGRLNATTLQLAGTPWVKRRGLMDTMRIRQGQDCSIALTVESEFSQWDRPVVRRYTDADQQSRYPGDRFFEFVEKMADKTVYWGQKAL